MARSITLGAGLAMTGLVASGCGKASSSPLQTVQAAAADTPAAHTAQVTESVVGARGPLGGGGLNYSGGFDFGARRGRLTVDTSSLGASPIAGKIDTVFDYSNGFVMYMHLPQLQAQLGKQWIEIDANALSQSAGLNVNLGSIAQAQTGDPVSGLRLLAGASQVTVVGTETVRGVSTTHYRVVEDLQKAADQAPASVRSDVEKAIALYKVPSLPADVWIDGQNLVRRYRLTIDPSQMNLPAQDQAGLHASGPLTVTVEFYNFGTPVDASVPPADQVVSLSSILQESGSR